MVSTTDGTVVGRVNPTELEFISGYVLDTIGGDFTIRANSGAGSVLLGADPTVPLAAATKQYVDAVATGLAVKEPVRAATTAVLAATRLVNVITASSNGAISIDNVSLLSTERVLVKDGLTGDTGIFEVSSLVCVAKASYTDNTGGTADFFDISSAVNVNAYRVYFDFSGANGMQPAAGGRTLVRVNISGDTSATDVGITLDGVLSGLTGLSATNVTGTVTVTNTAVGDSDDVVGQTAVSAAGMTVSVTTQGAPLGVSVGNGIYTVTTVGTAGTPFVLTRSTDADQDAEVKAGLFTFVEEGTISKDLGYVLLTNDPITVNTTPLHFGQFSSHGGDVTAPATSVDNSIARWDGTDSKILQDSLAILNDAGALSGLTGVSTTSLTTTTAITGNATGQILLDSSQNALNSILLRTNTGTSESITIQNIQGIGANAIQLDALSGGVNIDAAATKDVDIAGGQVLISSKDNIINAIDIRTNVGTAETITILNIQGTSANAITIDAGAGGISIEADPALDIDIVGGQVLLSNKGNVASAIALTTNIGTTETIVLTNTQGTATKAIDINATAGGVDISAAGILVLAGTGGTNISAAVFTGGAITGVITLTVADSGRTYSVVQTGGGYVVTLPTTAAGLNYKFVVITEAGGNTTITASGAHLFGSYDLGGTSTQIPGHTSILFDATDANVGDIIELNGIDATHWLVSARSSAASGISTAA